MKACAVAMSVVATFSAVRDAGQLEKGSCLFLERSRNVGSSCWMVLVDNFVICRAGTRHLVNFLVANVVWLQVIWFVAFRSGFSFPLFDVLAFFPFGLRATRKRRR